MRAQIREGFDPRVGARRVSFGTALPRTVRDAAERFIVDQKAKIRTGWANETERTLRVDVLPTLGLYPLPQLKRSDLAALISNKAAAIKAQGGKGTSANRLRAVLSRFTGFCEEHGWLSGGIGVKLPCPVVEMPRERILTGQELGSLWNAICEVRQGRGAILPVYGELLAMLALTSGSRMKMTIRTFGQVPLALWREGRFMALSDVAKLALIYMWCGPHSTSAGTYVLPDGYAAVDLNWNPKTWIAAREEVENSGLIRRDADTQTVLIRDFFVASRPSNAKHLAAIRTQINTMASPELKEEAEQALQSILP